jgi:hypothetical protein
VETEREREIAIAKGLLLQALLDSHCLLCTGHGVDDVRRAFADVPQDHAVVPRATH